MKRMVRFFIVIGATSFLFASFVLIFNKILENQLNNLYSDNMASVYGVTIKNQGVAMQVKR